MARRGFFAELQRASQAAARDRDRAQRDSARRHAAAVRESEQAQRNAERAAERLSKGQAAERKQAEREAREAHCAAQEALATDRCSAVEQVYDEIDSLLASDLPPFLGPPATW